MATNPVPTGDGGGGDASASTTPQAPAPAQKAVTPTKAFDSPPPIVDKRNADSLRGPAKTPKINPLPGVIDRVEAGEESPAEKEERAAREDGRPRDEQGRFTSNPDGTPKAPKQEAAPAPEGDDQTPDPTTETPTTPGKVRFLDKDYGSIKEVERLHKSLQGNFTTLKGQATNNFNSAVAWKAEAERVSAELEAYKSGKVPAGANTSASPAASGQEGQPTPGSASPSPVAQSFAESFDWNTYNRLKQVDPDAAAIFHSSALEEFMERKLEAKYEAKYGSKIKDLEAPVLQSRQAEEFNARVIGTITSLANQVDEVSGAHHYPELNDPQAREAILQIWSNSGVDASMAHHPYVIASAVYIYRNWKASQSPNSSAVRPSPAATATAAGVMQNVVDRINENRNTGTVDPPPSPALIPAGGRGSDAVANFKAGIRQAGNYGDGKKGLLGVMP